jgi:SAM-dependent methyltransferase
VSVPGASVRGVTAHFIHEPTPSSEPAGRAGEPAFLSATREAYDTVAADYAALLSDDLDANPFDRSVLALYAELVQAAATEAAGGDGVADVDGASPEPAHVAEIGSGPGRITAHLASLGLDVRGIDLSPAMVAEARRRHPSLEFSVGSMTALDLPDGGLDGLVAWYSVIHVPPSRHRAVYAGFRRALRPGGLLLLAFQCGDERRRLTNAYGHDGLALDAYRLPPDRVGQELAACGFEPVACLVREPAASEKTRQAYLVHRAR